MEDLVNANTIPTEQTDEAADGTGEALKGEAAVDNGASEEFGKFKSKEDLLKAYENLEKEFTKRSQKLKAMEKTAAEISAKPDWGARVEGFLERYPLAREFLPEVEKEVAENSDLLANENCLEIAFLKALSKNWKSPDDYAKDKEFLLKSIKNDAAVRDAVIAEYIGGLFGKNAPKTISTGGASPLNAPRRATTIEDAGAMAMGILNKK